MRKITLTLVLLVLVSGFISAEFDFSKIKGSISEFTLPNGLKFILLEDHSVPIATFVSYANVGFTDERIGIWGISHFIEHMAFKGNAEIGTNNAKEEDAVLKQMDALFDKILAERDSLNPDSEKIKKMEAELDALSKKADTYVVPGEFYDTIKKNGAAFINAGTGADSTCYFTSFPSNRLELWAYLESSRFIAPVFREFYKERGVIKEERRMRIENSPFGKLTEELLSVAYKDHPYHSRGIGAMSNLNHLSRKDLYDYFHANYTAGNIVIGVAGDVYPDQLKKVAEKYFSGLRPGKRNPPVFTVETEQVCEKAITLYEKSQPFATIAFHSPAENDPNFVKLGVLNGILASGRSSRLEKKLTIDNKIAMEVGAMNGFPGTKYPNLYIIFAIPNSGHTNMELVNLIQEELEKIKKDSVTEEELASAKTRLKFNLLKQFNSNFGLINGLLGAEVRQGSWKKIFDSIEAVDKVSTSDIKEIANKLFTKKNRIVAIIEKEEEVKK